MSSLPVPPRLLRRLLSAVLALSVLLTTLGLGYPSCDGSQAPHGAAPPSGAHAGTAVAHEEALSGGDTAAHAPQGCPDHDRHDEHGAAACALMAHCAPGVLASAADVPASHTLRIAPVVEATTSRPLDASYQPDSPPPKA